MNIDHREPQVEIKSDESQSKDDVFNHQGQGHNNEKIKTKKSFVFSEFILEEL